MPSLAFEILNVLGLIKNHVIPFFPSENGVICDSNFIAGDANMETIEFGPSLAFKLSFLGRSKVGHDLESGTPSFKLNLPIHEDSGWYDDQMRSPNAFLDS